MAGPSSRFSPCHCLQEALCKSRLCPSAPPASILATSWTSGITETTSSHPCDSSVCQEFISSSHGQNGVSEKEVTLSQSSHIQSQVDLRFQPASLAVSSGPPCVTRILEQMCSKGTVEARARSPEEGVKARSVRAPSGCRPAPGAAALLQDQT